MQTRDASGRFQSGRHSEETKQKISDTLRRHHKADPYIVERKFCKGCLQWLDAKQDFYWKKSVTKSRGVSRSPSSQCKLCDRKRLRDWEARMKKENPAVLEAKRRRQDRKRRNNVARKQYQAEYGRMERALQGKKPRPKAWKYAPGGRLKLVDAQPFVEWYSGLNGSTPTGAMLGERLARSVRRALSGEVQNIHLDIVDEVGVLVGEVHLIRLLYDMD